MIDPTPPEASKPVDLDDAESDILDSMSADDRQTKAQYQRGCAALSAVLAELRTLREAQRWTSVYEGLPAVNRWEEYLVLTNEPAMHVALYTGGGRFFSNHERIEIVAWRPLPALPDAPKGEL